MAIKTPSKEDLEDITKPAEEHDRETVQEAGNILHFYNVLHGSDIQKATIRRILEVIVLERITGDLFAYFRKIVDLKEIKIPKYHDITQMTPSTQSAPHENLGPVAKNNIKSLSIRYEDLESPISSNNESESEEQTVAQLHQTGPFKYTSADNFARTGLCVSKIKSDNYTAIYAAFQSIFKALTFNSLGHVKTSHLTTINHHLRKTIYNDSTNLGYISKGKINDFFENVCVSSFPKGNAWRATLTDKKWGPDSYTYRTYTTEILNDRTRDISGPYQLTDHRTLHEISSVSTDQNISNYSTSPMNFLASTGPATSIEQSCELLSACIFDLFYSLNTRKYTQDKFNNSTIGSTNTRGIEKYIKHFMGDQSLGIISSGFSPDDNITLSDEINYQDGQSGTIDHSLGVLGDTLFDNKKILDEKVECLPGSNIGYSNLNKTLSGIASIPLAAFGDQSLSSLDSYTANFENILNKSFHDIGKIFGIFNNGTTISAGTGQVTKSRTPLKFFDKMLKFLGDDIYHLAEHIDDLTNNQQTSNSTKKALSLLIAIAAGEDDSILSSYFMTHYLRPDGYFDDDQPWVKAMRSDAAAATLHRLFKGKFGKSLQYVSNNGYDDDETKWDTQAKYLTEEGDSMYWGQYANFWLQRKDVKGAADYTWINTDKFDNTKYFLGRPLESNDLASGDIMTFWSSNRKDFLFEESENAIRKSDHSVLDKSCSHFRDFLKDKDRSLYDSIMAQERKDIAPDIAVHINPESSNGSSSVSPKYDYLSVLKKSAERPGKLGKNYSLFESSDLQREFSAFAFLCKLLNKCLSARVRFVSEGSKSKHKKLKIDFSKKQLLAFHDEIKSSDMLGTLGCQMDSMQSEIDEEISKQKAFIKNAKKPLWNRINRVKVCYATLYSHLNNLHMLKGEIARQIHPSTLNQSELLAINYYGLISETSDYSEAATGEEPIIEDNQLTNTAMKKSLMFQLSSNSLPAFYKNYFDHVHRSKNSFLFPSWDNITDRQLYQMQLAFSGENYGHASSEKLGKKTILNVGIPPGQLAQLSATAQREHGDVDYFMTPYVCLHIFKKDALGGDIMYYPKPFIFNTSLVAFENCKHSTGRTLHPEFNISNPNHETEYLSINSFDSLIDNFSLYKYDVLNPGLTSQSLVSISQDMLLDPNDMQHISIANPGAGIKRNALKEMKINHIMDYYLKMYMKLTMGINMSETVFPLFEYNKIRGAVDSSVAPLFEKYRNELFLRYPSINVDPILAREFVRLEKNIASSRFFSLNEKVKNVFASKCFERIFSVGVNEADFVVYPYPDIITTAMGAHTNGNSIFDGIVENQAFVNSLPDLYDPCPYFNLNASKQIYGINLTTKAKLTQDLVLYKAAFPNMATNNSKVQDRLMSGKYRQMLKHLNEVESENVADVYEFFAVASVIRRK